jgi:hypothetical protein
MIQSQSTMLNVPLLTTIIIPMGRGGLGLAGIINFRLSHEKSGVLGTDHSDHDSTSKKPLMLLCKMSVDIHQ